MIKKREGMRMRKTKIICTIGPSSQDPAVLREMCLNGMNVARLNFSHGTYEEHRQKFDAVKAVRKELGMPVAIMLDTKGPEYRIGMFENHRVTLAEGQEFVFTADDVPGDGHRVSVSYKKMAEELSEGDEILVNNGLVVCKVTDIRGTDVVTEVTSGGVLSDKKSMNFPGKVLAGEYLSEQDKEDIRFGVENGADFVAASFVSTGEDVRDLRAYLNTIGGEKVEIIAKIENRAGVDNIEAICEYASGIMVARGDLGVELPFSEVPAVQKEIVEKCRMLGKRVIIATEMLESMIENIRPTRAEASDVANAIYDGASAIMLSGESAAGKHPVESVRTMAQIAEETEKHIDYAKQFERIHFKTRTNLDAISHAACQMAVDLNAKAIAVSSITGITARMISRFRCPAPIIGITTSESAYRKLALSWGVIPMLSEEFPSTDVVFYNALRETTDLLDLQEGDNVILTGGLIGSSTNTIRLETVKERRKPQR